MANFLLFFILFYILFLDCKGNLAPGTVIHILTYSFIMYTVDVWLN